MMNGPRWLMVVLIGLATLRLLGSIGAEEVSDARLLNAYQDATNWLLYGRDYSNQRYSPLDQIKVSNVKALIPKWAYRTGQVGSFQTRPLVVDGVMYATTPFNNIVELNARNGTPIWRYEHKLRTEKFCCGPANRGAAIGYGKVYTTTIDARLLALDQKTGRVVWDVTIAHPEAGTRVRFGEGDLAMAHDSREALGGRVANRDAGWRRPSSRHGSGKGGLQEVPEYLEGRRGLPLVRLRGRPGVRFDLCGNWKSFSPDG